MAAGVAQALWERELLELLGLGRRRNLGPIMGQFKYLGGARAGGADSIGAFGWTQAFLAAGPVNNGFNHGMNAERSPR